MKKTGVLSRILMAVAFLAVPTLAAKAQRAMVMVNVSITCESGMDVCYSYDSGDKTVNVAGKLVDVVVDGRDTRVCNGGAGDLAIKNIFLHTPGNPSAGRGYVGLDACVNPTQGSGFMHVPENAVVYDTFSAWQQAVSSGVVH